MKWIGGSSAIQIDTTRDGGRHPNDMRLGAKSCRPIRPLVFSNRIKYRVSPSKISMKTAGFEVGEADRAELATWLRSQRLAQSLGMRARVVMLSAEGHALHEIAERLGVTQRTVCLWRRRYQGEGLGPKAGIGADSRAESAGAKNWRCHRDHIVRPRTPAIGARGGWPRRSVSAS